MSYERILIAVDAGAISPVGFPAKMSLGGHGRESLGWVLRASVAETGVGHASRPGLVTRKVG